MRARILTSEKAVRDKVREEYQKYKDEVYRDVMEDVIPQVLAVVLFTLNKDFGFGEKRLRRCISGMKSYFKLMNTEIFNRKITTLDCLKYLKDEYGTDLDEEVRKM